MKPIKIIAIDPGVKTMGVAIMKDLDLRYWGIKRIRKTGMNKKELLEKTEKILLSLINRYKPDVLIIQKLFFVQQKESPNLKALNRKIRLFAMKNKIQPIEYNPLEVRSFLCQNGRPTKMKAAKTICENYYPFLFCYYYKDLNKKWWQEKYYIKMFNAIALGIYYLKNERHQRNCSKNRSVCL